MIDPGQAFGTGGHGSTRGSLELLARCPPGPVLDLGCGSGVLSIAAIRLGFASGVRLRQRPRRRRGDAPRTRAQRCAARPFVADAVSDALPDVPLWIANMLRRPLEQLLARPDAAARRAIVSGLVQHEQLDAPAYRVERRVVLDGWQAILLRRR